MRGLRGLVDGDDQFHVHDELLFGGRLVMLRCVGMSEEFWWDNDERSGPLDDRPFVSVYLRMLVGDLEPVTESREKDLVRSTRWTRVRLTQEKRAGRILYSRHWDSFFHPAEGL